MDENDLPPDTATAENACDGDPRPTYTPLSGNAVRLVRLHKPTAGDDTVKVDLITAQWPPSLAYEALSYVWGDPAIQKEALVSVDGAPHQPFPVTVNLHAALSHLRHEDRDRVLWIDAICIDQTNVEEKEQQVRKMGEIYQTARNVCVWFGAIETHDNRLAMHCIPHLVESIWRARVTHLLHDRAWKSFEELLQNNWFSRRWVIQEVALARQATVHYGNEEVSWEDLMDAISVYGSRMANPRSSRLPGPFLEAPDARSLGALTLSFLSNNALRKDGDGNVLERRWNVEDLLSQLPMFQAQLPHDTLFAILSLASDGADFGDVDYNMPPAMLFARVVQRIVYSSKSLDIMLRPWAPETPGIRLPSFIAPVSRHPYIRNARGLFERRNADSLVGAPRRPIYAAKRASGPLSTVELGTPNLSVWTSYLSDRGHLTLIVPGIICASISRLGNVCEDGVIPWDWLDTWKRGEEEGGEEGQEDQEDRLKRDVWRVLVAGRSRDGTTAPNWYKRAFERVFGAAACGSPELRAGGRGFNLADMIKACETNSMGEFLRRVGACVWGRRLLTSTRKRPGYFGLVPREAAAGDMICLLDGCSVPVVLRGGLLAELVLQQLQHKLESRGRAGPALEAGTELRFLRYIKRYPLNGMWIRGCQQNFAKSLKEWTQGPEFADALHWLGDQTPAEGRSLGKPRVFFEHHFRSSLERVLGDWLGTTPGRVVEYKAEPRVGEWLESFFEAIMGETIGHPVNAVSAPAGWLPSTATQDTSWAEDAVCEVFLPMFARAYQRQIEIPLRSFALHAFCKSAPGEPVMAIFDAAWTAAWTQSWKALRITSQAWWPREISEAVRSQALRQAAERFARLGNSQPYGAKVIGECYIQGLMDGEWWSGDEAKKMQPTQMFLVV
jgi:hypothetical protein